MTEWIRVKDVPAPADGTRFDAWCVHPKVPTLGVRFVDVMMRGDKSGFGVIVHTKEEVIWEYLEEEGPIYPEWVITHWRNTPEAPERF